MEIGRLGIVLEQLVMRDIVSGRPRQTYAGRGARRNSIAETGRPESTLEPSPK